MKKAAERDIPPPRRSCFTLLCIRPRLPDIAAGIIERNPALELLASLLLPLAQNPPAPAPTTQGPPGLLQSPLVPLMLGILVLWFFVFRAKNKQERSRTDMLAKLKPGERVQTIGGIIGTIHSVNQDNSVVTVKVDETNNVKIKFSRNAIHRVLDEEKAETK